MAIAQDVGDDINFLEELNGERVSPRCLEGAHARHRWKVPTVLRMIVNQKYD